MSALDRVLTVPEIVAMWKVNPVTVRRAINSCYKPLTARKALGARGGTWLITYESCVRRWGNPLSISA